MRIKYEKETRGLEFRDIKVGEVFADLQDDSEIFIKMEELETEINDIFNSIDLQTGEPAYFCPDERVRPLEAELILSDP